MLACATLRSVLGVASLSLCGCNAVLDIEPPSDVVTDGFDTPGRGASADAGAAISLVAVVRGSVGTDAGSGSPGGSASIIGAGTGLRLPLTAVAHAWAEWPMPTPGDKSLPNHQSYLSTIEGVVTDTVTQLQWQQVVDDGAFTWADAGGYCAALGIAGGGFRLPTRIELLSIVDYTVDRPTIDITGFANAPPERFWSASPFAGATDNAWLVNFGFGTGVVFADATSAKYRVRCVR